MMEHYWHISPKLRGIFYWLAIFIAFLVGLFYRLTGLGVLPFYLDEQLHTHQAIGLLRGDAITYTRSFLTVTLPVAISFKVLGISWLKARLPMVLGNLLGAVPLYFLMRKFGKAAAWVSLVLFFTNPWVIANARSVREYAIFPLVFYLALWLAGEAQPAPLAELLRQPQRALMWVASALLVIYVLFFDNKSLLVFVIFPIAVSAGLMCWAWLRQHGRLRDWLLVAAGTLAMAGLVFVQLVLSHKILSFGNLLDHLTFRGTFLEAILFSPYQHNYAYPILGIGLFVLTVALGVVAFLPAFSQHSRQLLTMVASFAFPLIFLTVINAGDDFTLRVRYGIIPEIFTIPLWGVGLAWAFHWLAKRLPSHVAWEVILSACFLVLFTNTAGLQQIYTFKGGPSFPITYTNHFRNSEAYEYMAQHIKPGDVVMMDRFYYNDEMYGNRWGQFRWVKANDHLVDKTKSIGEQMPDDAEGWLVLYPEAIIERFNIPLASFNSGEVHFKYHGKFGDTYIWYWVRR